MSSQCTLVLLITGAGIVHKTSLPFSLSLSLSLSLQHEAILESLKSMLIIPAGVYRGGGMPVLPLLRMLDHPHNHHKIALLLIRKILKHHFPSPFTLHFLPPSLNTRLQLVYHQVTFPIQHSVLFWFQLHHHTPIPSPVDWNQNKAMVDSFQCIFLVLCS